MKNQARKDNITASKTSKKCIPERLLKYINTVKDVTSGNQNASVCTKSKASAKLARKVNKTQNASVKI